MSGGVGWWLETLPPHPFPTALLVFTVFIHCVSHMLCNSPGLIPGGPVVKDSAWRGGCAWQTAASNENLIIRRGASAVRNNGGGNWRAISVSLCRCLSRVCAGVSGGRLWQTARS